MWKMVGLVKRKPGLTHEQFREHYENVHVLIGNAVAEKFCTDYRRSYVTDKLPSTPGLPSYNNGGGQDYDCITEFWFRDEEAMKGFFEYQQNPVVKAASINDEALFVDSPSSRIFITQEVPDRMSISDRPKTDLFAKAAAE